MQLKILHTTKILRTQYRVEIAMGGSVRSLSDVLTSIPPDARMIDEEEENGCTVLVFQVEKEEK